MVKDKYSLSHRNPFSAEHAISSFRNLDFDPISSICEIIDNSLQANATEIKIKFEWTENPEGGHYASQSVFIDNGDGMNEKTLYDYLLMGEGERKALSDGIGKFGVGATLAGISAARHIAAYSKTKGGKWMYTFLDIDEIEAGHFVPMPIQKDPPKEFNQSLENGTIIIWSNVDIIEEAILEENVFPPSDKAPTATTLHDEDTLTTEVGRIYRKFLTDEKLVKGKLVKNKNPATIEIQDQKVEPYDPIYATYNPKKDDKDKPVLKHIAHPIRFGHSSGKMHITTSYFPDSWFVGVGGGHPGNAVPNIQRKIGSRNEGISLVREGREIFFGRISRFYINDPGPERHAHTYKEHDRWTGFEIEFGREADDIFNIQANKSKLNIRKIMKQELSRKMSHTIVARRTEFSKKVGEAQAKKGKSRSTSTDKSKKKIQSVMDPKYDTAQKQALKKVAEKYVKNKKDQIAIDEAYNDLVNGYLPLADYDADSTDQMVKFSFELSSIIVKYNMNHPFLKKFTEALTDIGVKLGKESTETLNVEENQTLRTLLDILFVTYGLARISFDDLSKQREIQATINDLHKNWGNRAEEYSRKNLEPTS